MTAKVFSVLTDFIDILSKDEYGEWVIDKVNDGTPEHPIQMPYVNFSEAMSHFIKILYQFCEDHPEYEYTQYCETLEKNGLQWDAKIMSEYDVSNAEAKLVIALLIGAVRAERFCDGALLSFCENGSILRWLKRLKVIDD